ncbi:MAG: hypothetical protein CM15mV33_330 [uncultured marine virus]|nr:MAG: hypothetical protein CM15mV33_330 [uncultured marine virus]
MTDYYRTRLVIVGPIGKSNCIDFCPTLIFHAKIRSHRKVMTHVIKRHDEILIDLLTEEFNSHVYTGGIDLGDWSENGLRFRTVAIMPNQAGTPTKTGFSSTALSGGKPYTGRMLVEDEGVYEYCLIVDSTRRGPRRTHHPGDPLGERNY